MRNMCRRVARKSESKGGIEKIRYKWKDKIDFKEMDAVMRWIHLTRGRKLRKR
jgi:hypothetical protein